MKQFYCNVSTRPPLIQSALIMIGFFCLALAMLNTQVAHAQAKKDQTIRRHARHREKCRAP
jgi:hypothetical protein